MLRLPLLFIAMVTIISCAQKEKKQEPPVSMPSAVAPEKNEPVPPVKDTAIVPETQATPVAGEKEITIASLHKKSKEVPPYSSSGIYLHSKKEIDGSYLFQGPANELGVININGKTEKLKFVKGYEDEATYANADYELY